MTEKSASVLSDEKAHRLSERYDAYSLGLVFTVLALSIQTAKFGASPIADIFELASWLLLLFSGAMGLWRAEWHAHFYEKLSATQARQELAHEVRKAIAAGTTTVVDLKAGPARPIAEYLTELENDVVTLNAHLNPIANRQATKYSVMKWSFLAALATLVVGRAWIPLWGVVSALRQ